MEKTRGILSFPKIGHPKLCDCCKVPKSMAPNRVTVETFHGESSPRSQFRGSLSKNCVTFNFWAKAPRNVVPRGKRYGEGVFFYPRGSRNDARKVPPRGKRYGAHR